MLSLPRREVIDGQQRLTTLQLLLKAAEHSLCKVEKWAMDESVGSEEDIRCYWPSWTKLVQTKSD